MVPFMQYKRYHIVAITGISTRVPKVTGFVHENTQFPGTPQPSRSLQKYDGASYPRPVDARDFPRHDVDPGQMTSPSTGKRNTIATGCSATGFQLGRHHAKLPQCTS